MVGFERPDPAPRHEAAETVGTAAPTRAAVGLLEVARPRLAVGASDDPLEREADLVAQHVVAALHAASTDSTTHPTTHPTTDPTTHPTTDDGLGGEHPGSGAPTIRRVPAASRIRRRGGAGSDPGSHPDSAAGGELDADTSQRIQRARSGGRAVATPMRRSMEAAFGADLSAVRVHAGSESRELNERIQASAFTIGNDIFFRDGLPDADTTDGQELLAHELTHTLQQATGQQATGPDRVGRVQRRRGRKRRRGRGRGRQSGRSRRRKGGRRGGGGGRGPVITEPTADSAFTKLAWLVDMAAPTKGDSGSIEATVKIPLGPASFVQFDLEAEVERDDDIEIGAEIAVGYGGELPYGMSPEGLAKLGGFVESQGSTSTDALTLLSYGYYRQFREAGYIPRELTDRLWGRGGATGKSAHDEAEEWAALVESSIFGASDDAHVGMGLAAALEAEWDGDESGKAAIGGKIASATTYSKSTLEASGSDGAGQLGKAGKERTWSYAGWGLGSMASWFSTSVGESLKGRGAQLPVGETERKLSVEAALEYGVYSGEAELEIALSSPLEFELSASASADLTQLEPTQLADSIVGYITQIRSIIVYLREQQHRGGSTAVLAGETADALGEWATRYEASRRELTDAIAEQLPADAETERQGSVKVTVALEYADGGLKSELTISHVTAREVKRKMAGHEAAAKVERERRLFSLEWPRS